MLPCLIPLAHLARSQPNTAKTPELACPLCTPEPGFICSPGTKLPRKVQRRYSWATCPLNAVRRHYRCEVRPERVHFTVLLC